MAPAIYGLRLWMAFVTMVNLIFIIVYHAWYIPMASEIKAKRSREMYDLGITETDEGFHYEYTWDDYAIIVPSVILLPAYIYSIWGKRSLVPNKYARAVLMLLPALFMIGVQLRQVDLILQAFHKVFKDAPAEYVVSPFSCVPAGNSFLAACIVGQSYQFVPVVVGFFVIIEVAVTLFRGPLHSPKEAYL
ncbi:hypothetical protein K457DRAFT_32318 [Linnemannia elongata AG-77]|uniref:Uncharacterized protein n=1 Tax=Linnemannia elongata AG-77 TaxID=1314771 RepID=A0A197JYC5_9FUNG|nr:hypothetical protein K457DRAFT_32318 [Linnemannia elongata AG-77]